MLGRLIDTGRVGEERARTEREGGERRGVLGGEYMESQNESLKV